MTTPAPARGLVARWRRARSPRAAGLSLVEILVSLAILVVIGAVVVPWSIQWLGGRELDNAEDQLAMQMMMARAAAREEGRPVEVVATGATGVEARWMQADELLDDAGDGSGGRTRRDRDDDLGETGLAAIRAQWALLDLPAGVRIELDADGRANAATGDDDAFGARADAPALQQTLAIFLPDGTAILAPIFMLRTDGGMARAMRVDRATGRPREVSGGATRPFRSSPDPFRDRLGEESADDRSFDPDPDAEFDADLDPVPDAAFDADARDRTDRAATEAEAAARDGLRGGSRRGAR